jgi:signal transduction histidine kinase
MESKDKLTEEQLKELQKLTDEIIEEAKEVVKDYSENPSEMSGSTIQVHENSPYVVEKEDRLIKFDGKNMKVKKDAD